MLIEKKLFLFKSIILGKIYELDEKQTIYWW